MGQSADVKSHESVDHFRIVLIEFQESCSKALTLLETEKYQAIQWLEYDMPAHWKKQVRIRYDEISEARNRLRSCQMRGAIGDKKPSCIEEKKDLERAKKRQEFAQEMIHVVRKWAIKVHKEADEFTGRVGRCKTIIDNDVSHGIVLLRRMVEALERYLSMSTPSEESIQSLKTVMTRPVSEVNQAEDNQTEENSPEEDNPEATQGSENQEIKEQE
jgi:hypothetical protein